MTILLEKKSAISLWGVVPDGFEVSLRDPLRSRLGNGSRRHGGIRVTCAGSFARRLLGNESLCQLELKNSLRVAMHRFIGMRKTMASV